MGQGAQSRPRSHLYNNLSVADVEALAPGLAIRAFLAGDRVPATLSRSTWANRLPDCRQRLHHRRRSRYVARVSTLVRTGAMASLLSSDLDEANFAFGTTLSGVPAQRARWKRAVSLVESAVSEALGQIYVDRHFPPENKARMVEPSTT